MRNRLRLVALIPLLASTAAFAQSAPTAASLERGKHLVLIGHCNNCHTPGYTGAAGKVPEDRWLTGNPVGWLSRKGTTYASNLRLYVQHMSEADWIRIVRTTEWRAPMPWWSMRDHTDDELRDMFHYIRSLKPLGPAAPAFLPPDQSPKPPYQQLPDMSLPR